MFFQSVYCNPNVTRIRGDFAFAAGSRFRHVDPAGIAMSNKNFGGQERSGHIACIGTDFQLVGITFFKPHVTRAALNRDRSFRDDIF